MTQYISCQTQTKLLWSTFQIIAQFKVLLYYTIPPALKNFLEMLDITNLNPLSVLVRSDSKKNR